MKELKVRSLRGWKSVVGLMGKKHFKAVYFETRWGIHTFFVRFPIDIVILDRNNTICVLKCNLLPNRVFAWNPKYNRVLELQGGFIQANNLKRGERVIVTFL